MLNEPPFGGYPLLCIKSCWLRIFCTLGSRWWFVLTAKRLGGALSTVGDIDIWSGAYPGD
jgi:hypothetical protein